MSSGICDSCLDWSDYRNREERCRWCEGFLGRGIPMPRRRRVVWRWTDPSGAHRVTVVWDAMLGRALLDSYIVEVDGRPIGAYHLGSSAVQVARFAAWDRFCRPAKRGSRRGMRPT